MPCEANCSKTVFISRGWPEGTVPFVSVGAGDCDASGVSAAPAGLLSPLSVSYTHLDVYKRQVRRWPCKSGVKDRGSTPGLHLKLCGLSTGEGSGIPSVAVKCVDIRRNTSGEGDSLGQD